MNKSNKAAVGGKVMYYHFPQAGATLAVIEIENSTFVDIGAAFVSLTSKDRFDRARGRMIAEGRALAQRGHLSARIYNKHVETQIDEARRYEPLPPKIQRAVGGQPKKSQPDLVRASIALLFSFPESPDEVHPGLADHLSASLANGDWKEPDTVIVDD